MKVNERSCFSDQNLRMTTVEAQLYAVESDFVLVARVISSGLVQFKHG
ncbi:hypothetical protein [Sciscionella marina]|nr:hypothetical protein [Sciscionella marina]